MLKNWWFAAEVAQVVSVAQVVKVVKVRAARASGLRKRRNEMRVNRYIGVLMLLVSAAAQAADRPNILFMMSDDQAWNGLSAAMHPDLDWSKSSIVDTPNLEKLAAQGCDSRRPTPPHRSARQLGSACRRARVPLRCTGPRQHLPRKGTK